MNDIKKPNMPIAIIGIGCMFAKSSNLKEFWQLINRGEDGIVTVPDTHWSPADYYDKDMKRPDHVYARRGGFIPPITFDPSEFGIPPANLEATDTSQLLGLLAAKAALNDAGYLNEKPFNRDKASVILGATGTQELAIPLGARLGHPHWRRALSAADIPADKIESIVSDIAASYVPWQENSFPGLLGNVVSGRICNRLDLGGTNCVVDAACASSMSALHLSLMELTTGRSDLVITGGVDLLNDIFMHMCFSSTYILSPTEDIRPFSKHADGTLLGEGLGMIVLKRLDEAEQDGDKIYAVIRAIGTSSDGKSQSIYAPRTEGQEKSLRTAYDLAQIPTDTVTLIEAHGTGTRVGDQVEFQTLKNVFGATRKNGRACALGSVKSQIGHSKAAAGSAGIIKTALALHHKILPPTLKAEEPDPNLGIEDSPFYLNRHTLPWFEHSDHPRRAGVSSFGFGGSNFHVILEEYTPRKQDVSWDGSVEIIAFSGASRDAIRSQLTALANGLQSGMTQTEVAREAWESRQRFSANTECRLLITLENTPFDTKNIQDLISKATDGLAHHSSERSWQLPGIFYGTGAAAGKIAMIFPGQGSQYVGMGKDLVCTFPEALSVLTVADQHFRDAYSKTPRLSDIIFPLNMANPAEKTALEDRLRSTDHAQPAIGAISLAMWRVLQRFNIQPAVVCGHSFGELTALCAAGWCDEPALHTLSIHRGKCMAAAGNGQDRDAGTMMAVMGNVDELSQRLAAVDIDVVLANRNSQEQGVLSGPAAAITLAETMCRDWGFKTKRLPVSAAFHSPLMATACQPFETALASVEFSPTPIVVYANTDGNPYPENSLSARERLGDQLVKPVEFIKNIQNMYKDGVRTFLEVGPKSVLTGLCQSILKDEPVHTVSLDGSSGSRNGVFDLAIALCRLSALGYPVALDKWEEAVSQPATPKMSIPLSGANYRSKRPKQPMQPKPDVAARPQPKTGPSASPKATPRHDIVTTPLPLPSESKPPMTMQENGNPPKNIETALRIAEQGLKSIQALQMKTAETHQKFLDTQAEAGRVLKEMLGNAQQMAGSLMDIDAPCSHGENTFHSAPAAPRPPVLEPKPALNASPATVTAPEPDEPEAIKPSSESSTETSNVATRLLSVVSNLTGYPKEMLALDMDIEADLGIDSIKRVEILSTLEEAIPGLPPVKPDVIGRLKTLGQIVSLLENTPVANNPSVNEPTEPTPASPPINSPETTQTRDIQHSLLSIVSKLTGYPEDMLDVEMDIESDLGIDSIKRVEILSTLEEAVPGLPRVQPEVMGRLKTLGQIISHLTDMCPPSNAAKDTAPEPPKTPKFSPAALENTLLSTVSRLTGYPEEMLGLDMDIEADLGIDSIKRVEILSALEEALPGLPRVAPEAMGRLKTLGHIVEQLSSAEITAPPADQPVPVTPTEPPPSPADTSLSAKANIARSIIRIKETPYCDVAPTPIDVTGVMYVTDDRTGLSPALVSALTEARQPAKLLSKNMMREILSSGSFPSDACGLVLVPDPNRVSNDGRDPQDISFLTDCFHWVHHAAPTLTAAAEKQGALLASVSRLDGAFGFHGEGFRKPAMGGLAGLIKTAAIEWKNVTCRALDVSADWADNHASAHRIATELLNAAHHDQVETGLTPKGRNSLVLSPQPYKESDPLESAITAEDVFIITGGARGVTAAAALALAQTAAPKLLLLGRSDEPFREPAWLSSFSTPADMKKAIITHEFTNQPPSPRLVEAAYKRYLANREITKNLQTINATGAQAYYFQIDVRNKDDVAKILETARAVHGPITAIVHGAGVLEDRLIVDKTPEQVTRVLETKIRGIQNILTAVQSDPLKYMVFFSSVAARFGNRGQADYAMANEVLNKIAGMEAALRANCRAIAINWGPWDGGMVTDALKHEFKKRNIDLIPMAAGARCVVKELGQAKDSTVSEIVLGAAIQDPAAPRITNQPNDPLPQNTELSLLFKREIDLQHLPVLESHQLDGVPVVPFALIAEWIGHGAMHGNPGLFLHGLNDMRLLQGIRIENKTKIIRLMAGKARKNGEVYEVDVEIRNGVKKGKDVIHSRAKAVLSQKLPEAPILGPEFIHRFSPYEKSVQDVYAQILFHGIDLQGLKRIIGLSAKGMAAEIAPAPAPEKWMIDPMRSQWISDPLALDCAFQMACLWCHEQLGAVSLPSYTAAYRQFCREFPADGVIVVLEVTHQTPHKMTGDFTFFDTGNRVVATLSGYEAISDTALYKAFKKDSGTLAVKN